MTSSLPAQARECFARFITTEFTTVDARQQPITWPVTPYYADGGPTIDVSSERGSLPDRFSTASVTTATQPCATGWKIAARKPA